MRILVDMDGIVTDLLGKWLAVYNHDFDDCLTVAMVDSWHLNECVRQECSREQLMKYILQPGFFDDLHPLPGGIEGVKRLKAMGHDVKFATAPAGPDCARAKLAWIDRYFAGSGLSSLDVFLTHDKTWIDADLLIDDKPETLEAWNLKSPLGLTATIEYAYNAHLPVNCMADGCNDTEHAWEQIIEFVDQLRNLVIFRPR